MQRYILRRLVLMVPTLFGTTFLVFAMMRLMPGDFTDFLGGDFGALDAETKALIQAEFGLDENWAVQYVGWIADLLRGDFGVSVYSGRPINDDLIQRLPITLELGILAMVINVIIGIPIGIVSAIRQFSWYDYVGRASAIGLLAVPNFWIALLAIALAGKYALWAVPPPTYPGLLESPIENLRFMLFPAILTGAAGAGYEMRFGRTAMLEVMRQDYIRTAWSKGLQERAVIIKHGLRNALIPIVTVIGLFLPGLIGGTVVIETIYSIPGMGRYFIHALNGRDLFIVQALAVIFTLVVIFSNFVVDILYSVLNPRIRYS